jgi:hypothetical protein
VGGALVRLRWRGLTKSVPCVCTLGRRDGGNYDAIAFVKNDPAERKRCYVPIPALKGYLTKERQTTRGNGNWGIKVLKGRVLKGEDLLAFEPRSKNGK